MKPNQEDNTPHWASLLRGALAAALLLSGPAHAETAGPGNQACCSRLNVAGASGESRPVSNPEQKITRRYACDLRGGFSQCRQYTFELGASENIARMEAGCTSMGGVFGELRCPIRRVSGVCRDIVLDYRKPDIAYDNYYYQDASGRWTPSAIQRTCTALEGEYSKQ